MKRFLILVMSVVLLVTSVPCVPFTGFVSQAAEKSMVVEVTESKVTVKLSGVGTAGNASVIKMGADEYFSTDTLKGLSDNNSSGEVVGTYACGTTAEVSFPRYSRSLEDNLYCKYYVVLNGSVLYGPVYATEISAPVDSVNIKTSNKKGLYVEGGANVTELQNLGCSNTAVRFDFSQFVLPNEDRNENVLDQSNNPNALSYVSNGSTYYFNKTYIESVDKIISAYSKSGINVNLIILADKVSDFTKYPYKLIYTTANAGNYMAFNTSNAKGRGYFTAAMEFLADRYSRTKESGFVKNFVIGNEIDYAYENYAIKSKLLEQGITTLDVFMEEYSRTLRLANLAVKKYCKDMTVTVPLSHNWATSGYENSDKNKNASEFLVNSFAPKNIVDWLSEKTSARGNYDWAIAPSSSFSVLSSSEGTALDTGAVSGINNFITGDYNSTKIISYSNLEVLQQYLELSSNKFNGKVRDVHLLKAGISSNLAEKNNNSNKDYEKQAAYLAYSFYKASLLDCIKSFTYYSYKDNLTEAEASECFGLVTAGNVKKPSYEVFREMNKENSFETTNQYLSYIKFKKDGKVYSKDSGNISSYKDAMNTVNTVYDWDTLWNDMKIISSNTDVGVVAGLQLEKYQFTTGEDIKVTATGDGDTWVGIYKSDDNVNAEAENGIGSIYWYYVNKTNDGKKHISGKTYTIQKDGEFNSARGDLGNLPKGEYKIVLFKDAGYTPVDTIYITITDKASAYVKTNKTEYAYGENIYVSAAGTDNSKTWVGIYKKEDKVGSVDSVYWYYTDNSGAPVIIQNQEYNPNNSIKSEIITNGEYVVYLFKETDNNSYNELAKTTIKVNASKPAPFRHMTYSLDNETDGFANGTVTVTLLDGGATDCVLFWGDDNGPLKGYSSLASFKLTGKVTEYRFPTHTIIPEGATRLLAYSSYTTYKNESDYKGFIETISDTCAEVSLPEGSAYKIGNNHLTEFQVISDIHIASDQQVHNEHFKKFLEDVTKNSPKSKGVFVVGDIANNGRDEEYRLALSIINSVNNAPDVYIGIGNHDWYGNNPNGQFEKYISKFNSKAVNNGKVYYDKEIDGNYYIFLGSEQRGNSLHAYLSNTQLSWLKGKIEAYTAKEPNKPIFLFLHQSFYNTIAGSLPGEGWNGIDNEGALANILKGYNNVIFFNGHSHWVLDSTSNMFVGTDELPTAFNTSSVAYLWTGYNVVGGQDQTGSEGYYIRTYDDKVLVMGKDFVNDVYNPSAMYVVEPNKITTSQVKYSVSADADPFNIEANVKDKTARIEFASSDENVAIVDALGNVSVKNPGTAVISLYSDSTDTKTIAKSSVTVEVTASTQEIKANDFVKTYGDADFAINARYNGNPPVTYTSDNENVATVSSNGTVSVKGAGTARITIQTAAVAGYNAATKTISVTVRPAEQTFSENKTIEKVYGAEPFSVSSFRTKGDGALTFSSDNTKVATVSSNGVVTITGAGTAKITVTAAASVNYKKASDVITLTVTAEGQVISASDITKSADTAPFKLGAVLQVGDGSLSYTSGDESVATISADGTVTVLKAGVTNITIKASETASYKEATKTVKLTVNKADQIISAADSITKTTTDSAFFLGVTLMKGDGTLSYSVSDKNVCEVDSDGKVTLKNGGEATITVTSSATDKYNTATKTIALKVNKAEQIITASDLEKSTADKTFSLASTLTKGDGTLTYTSSNTSVATVSADGTVTIKGKGETEITITVAATGKYNSASKKIKLTVKGGVQVFNLSDMQKYADAGSFTLKDVLTTGDGKLTFSSSNESVATVSSTGVVTVKKSGSTKITVKAASTENFAAAEKTVTLTVVKAEQVITASNVKKTTVDKAFNIGAILDKGEGKLTYSTDNSKVATVSSEGVVTIKGSGTAKITIKAAATDIYESAEKTVTVTVSKAKQKISASSVTKSTHSDPFNIGAKLTTGDGKLTYKTSDKKIATVSKTGVVTIKGDGVVKITITAAETSKYKSASKTVKVTVKKKKKIKQTIKASDITKTYGAKKFKLGAKLTKGAGKLTYKSSNKNVVSVSSKGYITIKGVGYAYITVTAAETVKYKKATKKVLIKVNPKAVSVKSLKKTSSTSAKLTWKADKKVTGYIIEYSTSKKFTEKTTKKITVNGGSKTAKTIEGLKKGKKYYVRIRSYKKGNVKVYSSYKSLSIKM